MKRLITLACMMLAIVTIHAQNKVVESSAKKVPAWLGTAVEGKLVVSVTAPTLAQAQVKAMNEVTERIILSVASNVSVTQRNVASETMTNDGVESRDEYNRIAKMKSANLPFLKGISQAKVEEVYWRRMRDKQTKKEFYEYSVLYPYSRAEQRTLQSQFEKIDAEKVAQYQALENGIDDIADVADIKAAITQLAALKEYFFDDVRVKQVEGLMLRYRQLYDALAITGRFTDDNTYLVQVLLKGKPVRVAKVPTVKSNCAGQISIEPQDGAFLISFDATDCLPEEENFLDIQLRIENKKLQQRAIIGVDADATINIAQAIVPEGKIILTANAVNKQDRTLTDINIRMTLNNRQGITFGLKSIELEVPELTAPLVFDDIDAIFGSKGIIQVKALAEGTMKARTTKKSRFAFVKGTITVVNPTTNGVERIKVSLPYTTNWEE